MNPILVIAAFVILLAILLYYMQKREIEPENISRAENQFIKEKNVIKASDYQAQYETEQKEETSTTETEEDVEEEPPVDDISMLEGVGPKYQELLRAAGYSNIKSIAETDPETLYQKLIETNTQTGITKRPPTRKNLDDWIKAAGSR